MYIIIIVTNQMRVDATLKFNLKGYLEGNEGKTTFPLIFILHRNMCGNRLNIVSYMFFLTITTWSKYNLSMFLSTIILA